ncbi:hypothetical protein C8J56DRAFT_1028101 [Mycena floridula]|nr:hypothetical protein C8J56DRAFT_1028101 [Mycena floridula]
MPRVTGERYLTLFPYHHLLTSTMDFLKNLSLDDKEKQQSHPAVAQPEAAKPAGEHHSSLLDKLTGNDHHDKPAPAVVAPPEPPKEHGLLHQLSDALGGQAKAEAVPPPPVAKAPESHGLLGKLSGALGGGEHHPEAAAVPPPLPPKPESLLDKVSHAFSGDHPHPVAAPAPVVPKHEHFIDKVGNAFGEHHTSVAVPVTPPVPPKHESFLDKLTHKGEAEVKAAQPAPEAKHHGISGIFSSTPPAAAVVEPKHENPLDKLSHAISGEHHSEKKEEKHEEAGLLEKMGLRKTPEPPKDENLFDKLGNKLRPQPPPKEESFTDKVTGLFGGGVAAEKKEDHLDKAVDFVQEHVLHQGSQKNESVLEQLKDKQIAGAVRDQYEHLTGHELPGSKKHH